MDETREASIDRMAFRRESAATVAKVVAELVAEQVTLQLASRSRTQQQATDQVLSPDPAELFPVSPAKHSKVIRK